MKFVTSVQATLLTSLCIICLLAGCGSTGNQKVGALEEAELKTMLKNDLRTKSDVAKAFGDPDGIDFDSSGNEKCVYKLKYRESKVQKFIPIVSLFSRGTDDQKKKVVFIFAKDGSILHSTSTHSKGETSVGILG